MAANTCWSRARATTVFGADGRLTNRLCGTFRLYHGSSTGLGSVRETDGVELNAHDFWAGFRQGLVVVQDGDKAS